MGSGTTKILSYEDAARRFPQSELTRIENVFRDINQDTNGPAFLSCTTFNQDAFGNFLPEKLAERLYRMCSSSSRLGMSSKDLICCLALVFFSSEAERLQLLYELFNQSGTLRWQDVQHFLAQCGDRLPDELDQSFESSDIVSQERFRWWLTHRQGPTTTITDWLLDQQRLHELLLMSKEKVYGQYAILAGVTHLSEREIKELESSFGQLNAMAGHGRLQQMTFEGFTSIVSPVLPPVLIDGFFEAFDANRDGCIDFKEFVCGVSASCRGPQFEKCKFLFRVFDRDHDGQLGREDLLYMASCLLGTAQFVYATRTSADDAAETYVDRMLQYDPSKVLSAFNLEDFLTWCQKDSLVIELLDLSFGMGHLAFGLRSCSHQDEVTIVKHCLRREKHAFMEVGEYAPLDASEGSVPSYRHTSRPGSSWFLIDMDWWIRWEGTSLASIITSTQLTKIGPKASLTKSDKADSKRDPGSIDNASLIEQILSNDCVQLKANLRHGIHFEMVPEILWVFLSKYYRSNGPVLSRKVMYRKPFLRPELDLYPLMIKIYLNQIISPKTMPTTPAETNPSQSAYPLFNYVSATMFGSSNSTASTSGNTSRHSLSCLYAVSLYQTVRSLAEELSRKFGKNLDEIRLWMRFNDADLRQIDFESVDDYTCQEAGFNRASEILLEIRNSDVTWPEELYILATRARLLPSPMATSTSSVEEEGRGQIGLSNLGNTCFLNAAVQCLSHSWPLTFYFRNKYHLFEINKENPIGMQGNIALCYGQLVAKLWGSVRGPLAPFELRGSVAKFGSSRFTDFQQHDSQEFLAFLLDGLHEDLNRVHDKPYVELKDSDDRADEEVAQEYWSNHLARNTSIIVDLFHGLLRSQVKCRTCDFKSVRFDPYNMLSLPLSFDTTVYVEIKLIRLDGSKPVRYGLRLDGDLTLDHLKKALATLASLSTDQIGFFNGQSPSSLRPLLFMDSRQTRIKQLNVRDLLAYELPVTPSMDDNNNGKAATGTAYMIGMHRRLERQERCLSPLTREKILFFGQPMIIPYRQINEAKVTNRHIYENVFQQLERLLRKRTDTMHLSNHALDCDDSLGQHYPFVLKHVNGDGSKCSICPWNRFCLGCSFDSNDMEFYYTESNIAIDWESSTYYLRYLSGREQEVDVHSSVMNSRSPNSSNSAVDRLEDCLQSFINWENLDQKEMFQCKRCKQLQPADKKLDIWKLPPCLVFHIKRFQLSNNRWVKSSRPVRFPIRSFYPSKYLAQRSTVPVERRLSSSSVASDTQSLPSNDNPSAIETETRTCTLGDNSFDTDQAAYHLYALVCHYGVIGGGHYVAFVKNHVDQKWYCFNDSSCKPVSESVLEQCSSSAYLLFYERDSLDHRVYMPNVEGKEQVANELTVTGDDRWCSIM